MKVLLVDDQPLLRVTLAEALRTRGVAVHESTDAVALVDVVRRDRPDVVVLDIRMPPTYTIEGVVAAQALRRELPGTPVMLLSHHVESGLAVELIGDDAGGVGYLLKDRVTRIDPFVDALERVAAGGSVIDPEVVTALMARHRTRGPLDELTPREREVLAAMAEGASNRRIGTMLGIEDKTVERHITQILGKLGLEPDDAEHRRVRAVLVWLRASRTT